MDIDEVGSDSHARLGQGGDSFLVKTRFREKRRRAIGKPFEPRPVGRDPLRRLKGRLCGAGYVGQVHCRNGGDFSIDVGKLFPAANNVRL